MQTRQMQRRTGRWERCLHFDIILVSVAAIFFVSKSVDKANPGNTQRTNMRCLRECQDRTSEPVLWFCIRRIYYFELMNHSLFTIVGSTYFLPEIGRQDCIAWNSSWTWLRLAYCLWWNIIVDLEIFQNCHVMVNRRQRSKMWFLCGAITITDLWCFHSYSRLQGDFNVAYGHFGCGCKTNVVRFDNSILLCLVYFPSCEGIRLC